MPAPDGKLSRRGKKSSTFGWASRAKWGTVRVAEAVEIVVELHGRGEPGRRGAIGADEAVARAAAAEARGGTRVERFDWRANESFEFYTAEFGQNAAQNSGNFARLH